MEVVAHSGENRGRRPWRCREVQAAKLGEAAEAGLAAGVAGCGGRRSRGARVSRASELPVRADRERERDVRER